MKKEIIKTSDYLLIVSNEKINTTTDYILRDNSHIMYPGTYNITMFPEYKHEKIIAHLPLNNAPILEGVSLLPELSIEDDIEKLIYERWSIVSSLYRNISLTQFGTIFRDGYKATTKVYSEEDVRKAIKMAQETKLIDLRSEDRDHKYTPEEIIQTINQPKYPKYFIPEMETIWARNTDRNVPTKDDFDYRTKTTINKQGQIILVGKYEY